MLSAMHSTPVSDHANVEAQECARADQGRPAEFAIRLVMVVSTLGDAELPTASSATPVTAFTW